MLKSGLEDVHLSRWAFIPKEIFQEFWTTIPASHRRLARGLLPKVTSKDLVCQFNRKASKPWTKDDIFHPHRKNERLWTSQISKGWKWNGSSKSLLAWLSYQRSRVKPVDYVLLKSKSDKRWACKSVLHEQRYICANLHRLIESTQRETIERDHHQIWNIF